MHGDCKKISEEPKENSQLENVKQKLLSGGFGTHCTTLLGSRDKIVTIGLECPLLSTQSPFTYVSTTPLVAIYVPLENLLRQYE